MVSLALLAAFRLARRTEVVVHEIDYTLGRRRGPDGVAARRLWRRVRPSIQLHTETERATSSTAFGVRARAHRRSPPTAPTSSAAPALTGTRPGARSASPPTSFVFLAIGFIQPHKGFDRAVRAFAGLGAARAARCDVVGSVRVEEPQHLAYLAELQALIEATPGAHLHNQYVSDEQFDRWLVASDVVVLPYRNIWSSGVLERAALYDRPVIATAVGGLGHQAAARPGVTLVDDAGLAAAMWRARGQAGPGPDAAWPAGPERLRERVQEQVVARATRRRGLPVRTGDGRPAAATGQGSLPLRRLPPLGLPPPTSARPGVSLLKRLVRRATGWQVDPLVAQVNALREVTIQALERTAQLEREAAAGRDRDPG